MDDLMTLDDIAKMHRCSQRHARDIIVKLPGFPAEAPTSTPRNRLWIKTEVRAYVGRKRQNIAQIPHNRLKAA